MGDVLAGPALITGGAGFVGRALARHLAADGLEVVTLDRPGSRGEGRHLEGDVTDRSFLASTLEALRPAAVFHLAGTSSEADLEQLHRLNALSAVHLCEVLERVRPGAAAVFAGSAAEYGLVPPDELPAREDRALSPSTHYGASKAMQTVAVLPFARSGLRVVVARLANVIGPRMPRSLALGRWLEALAAQLPGDRLRLVTGPLGAVRDFVDVRDVARILGLLAGSEGARGQVVNVCSGQGTTLRALAEALRQTVARRFPGSQVTVHEEEGDVRRGPTSFVADVTRLAALLGPLSLTPLEQTLEAAVAEELELA